MKIDTGEESKLISVLPCLIYRPTSVTLGTRDLRITLLRISECRTQLHRDSRHYLVDVNNITFASVP